MSRLCLSHYVSNADAQLGSPKSKMSEFGQLNKCQLHVGDNFLILATTKVVSNIDIGHLRGAQVKLYEFKALIASSCLINFS